MVSGTNVWVVISKHSLYFFSYSYLYISHSWPGYDKGCEGGKGAFFGQVSARMQSAAIGPEEAMKEHRPLRLSSATLVRLLSEVLV